MQTLRKTALLLALLLVTACGTEAPRPTASAPNSPTSTLAQPATNTPETVREPTVTAPEDSDEQEAPAPGGELPPNARLSGPRIEFDRLRLTLPPALGEQVTATQIQGAAGADLPYWGVYPAHPQLTLDGYALQGTVLQPRVELYPVEEYAAISEAAASEIAALRALLAGGPRAEDALPMLPPLNAMQVLRARVAPIGFEGGRGLRYLTQYDQNIAPINNRSLFYTFQGLTDDGQHYISAIFPVSAPFLAEGFGPAPKGGVPFSDTNADGFVEQMGPYLQQVGERLEALPGAEFTPDLALLDELVTSIAVN